MIYFTSDTHFHHKNIIKYCDRPYEDVNHMNSDIIDKINERVGRHDTLYHAGDLSFSDIEATKDILCRITCKDIHLVLGNHDDAKACFQLLREGWLKSVQYYLEIRRPKADRHRRQICIMHYPMAVWNKCHRGSIHLFGHSHGTHNAWRNEHMPNSLSMDIGVDCHNYYPISLEEIDAIMDPRREKLELAMDHHR